MVRIRVRDTVKFSVKDNGDWYDNGAENELMQ